MAESKKMLRREVAFMKKNNAPTDMVRHEEAEAGMKKSGVKKLAKGGSFRSSADGVAKKGKTKAMRPAMAKGGKMKGC